MTDSEQLLDIEQAARFLNVSETSLRRWTNAGRLACLRVGRRRERRFRTADLLSFMESQPAVREVPRLHFAPKDLAALLARYGLHGFRSWDLGEQIAEFAPAALGRRVGVSQDVAQADGRP